MTTATPPTTDPAAMVSTPVGVGSSRETGAVTCRGEFPRAHHDRPDAPQRPPSARPDHRHRSPAPLRGGHRRRGRLRGPGASGWRVAPAAERPPRATCPRKCCLARARHARTLRAPGAPGRGSEEELPPPGSPAGDANDASERGDHGDQHRRCGQRNGERLSQHRAPGADIAELTDEHQADQNAFLVNYSKPLSHSMSILYASR